MTTLQNLRDCCNTTRLSGYLFLLVYLIASLTLAECAQITLSHINRVYFVRYINSSMAIMLFLFPLYSKLKHKTNKNSTPTAIQMQLYNNSDNKSPSTEFNSELPNTDNNNIIKGSLFYFLAYTIVGTLLHTGGGFLYYLSFNGITVPTAVSLGRLRAIWVYILSIIFLKQIISIWKCLAVMTSFMGIFCYVYEVSNSNLNDSNDTWWGCLASLAAGVSWSIYDVWTNITYKKYFPNSKYYGSILYEALIGFWTIFIFWFVIFIQQPIFDENTNKLIAWKWIIITGIALTVTNAAFYVALNLTSPVFMNYAAFLSIPLSFVLDVFVHGYKITVLPVFGAFFIVLGFVMLEIVGEPKCFKKLIKQVKRKVIGYENDELFGGSDTIMFIKNVDETEIDKQMDETAL
eukprot:475605_1